MYSINVTVNPSTLAYAKIFARMIRETLGDGADLYDANMVNRQNAYGHQFCATHDHIDANDVAILASAEYQRVHGAFEPVPDSNFGVGESELIDAGWQIAKMCHFENGRIVALALQNDATMRFCDTGHSADGALADSLGEVSGWVFGAHGELTQWAPAE